MFINSILLILIGLGLFALTLNLAWLGVMLAGIVLGVIVTLAGMR